ncbi:MAG: XRE family transcriptional regulator [Thermodesulfobacteriota bacterium]
MSKRGRNWFKIDDWMRHHGLSVTKIQREIGFKNHGVVSNTIAGRKNNRKVLRLLVAKGCPVRYLALPDDMREAA